jgi:hypothetical protein
MEPMDWTSHFFHQRSESAMPEITKAVGWCDGHWLTTDHRHPHHPAERSSRSNRHLIFTRLAMNNSPLEQSFCCQRRVILLRPADSQSSRFAVPTFCQTHSINGRICQKVTGTDVRTDNDICPPSSCDGVSSHSIWGEHDRERPRIVTLQ